MGKRVELRAPDGLTVGERCRRIEAEPLPVSLNALLDEAAAEAPDQTIWHFVEDDTRHSYAKARLMVLEIAAALDAWGVRKGDAVAVMLPNVVEYPLLWFALARIGAVVVPVNMRYASRELDFVLRKSRACRLVLHESCVELLTPGIEALLPEGGIAVSGDRVRASGQWSLDAIRQLGAGQQPPEADVTADDLVNIQFTSGTTGFPKGCELTHRYWLISGKVNAERDGRIFRRIWASTPFTYMDPHWLLLMAVFRRGTLFVARGQSASRFIGWMRDYGIEFCIFPALALKKPKWDHDADNALIRANVYGVTPHNRRLMEARFGMTAREAFGMTEIGSGLFLPMEAEDKADAASCGRPAPFRRLRVVDEDGRELPAGQVGELQVAGPGILRGYFDEPEATRRAFEGEWFRTGDLFWQDEDGYFYIVGRIKDSIRRSGENISAREIEAVMRELESVYEVAAIPVPHETRGEEVKICVIPSASAPAPDAMVARILEHAAGNLAVFKRPRFICFLKEFPLTPSGKVAKQVLRDGQGVSEGPAFDRETAEWLETGAARSPAGTPQQRAGRVNG